MSDTPETLAIMHVPSGHLNEQNSREIENYSSLYCQFSDSSRGGGGGKDEDEKSAAVDFVSFQGVFLSVDINVQFHPQLKSTRPSD